MPCVDSSSCNEALMFFGDCKWEEVCSRKHRHVWYWVTCSSWVHGLISTDATPRSPLKTSWPSIYPSCSRDWCSTERRTQKVSRIICCKKSPTWFKGSQSSEFGSAYEKGSLVKVWASCLSPWTCNSGTGVFVSRTICLTLVLGIPFITET